jgi:shikimate dehydrogenase
VAEGQQLIRLALFGQPVAASLSPAIHRQFAAQCGLEVEYRAVEAGVAEFPGALDEFRHTGGVGCNVTLPLKTLAWELAFERSIEAKAAQAANTLVARPGGWYAHNTDGIGFMSDLVSNHGMEPAGKRVVVLGAGGAVAGILGALREADPASLVLVNRNLDRAHGLAARFGGAASIKVIGWGELDSAGQFDLIINATSLGHAGEVPPVAVGMFAQQGVCYDLNYGHAATPLRKWCDVAGRRYVDGLGMLVEQAAASFEAWTGKHPDGEVVITALRSDTT